MLAITRLLDAKDPEKVKLFCDKIYNFLTEQFAETEEAAAADTGMTVKSIQHGQTVLSASSTTQAVTTVDTTNYVLLISQSSSADNVATLARGVLTNATTLTFTRGQNTGTTTIEWTLIEYE